MAGFRDYLPNGAQSAARRAYGARRGQRTVLRRDADQEIGLEEVLIEMHQVGNSVKVSAIDPVTNTEVSIVGPVTAAVYTLKINAVRKLEAVIRKNQEKGRPY